MEQLARKKKIRGGHRSSATRTITQIYEAIENPDNPESTLTKLKQCKMALEEKRQVVKRCDEEILEQTNEDDLEDEIEQADVFAERVQRAIIDVTNAIAMKESSVTPVTVPSTRDSPPPVLPPSTSVPPSTPSPTLHTSTPSTPTVSSPAHPPSLTTTKVKLPRLTLKRFNGDVTKWCTFWDSFESSIHLNPELADIDKFNYLHSLLEGVAAEAISGLKLTTANYEGGIAILKKRFGNKQNIITKHMEILLNVDAVTSQYNIKGLRHLYDLVESQVRGLRALGVPPESYGSLLSSVLINKLPQELRLIASREVKGEEWELDELMKIVEAEIKARERATVTKVSNRVPPTGTTLVAHGANLTVSCSYCRQPHPSNSCSAVTDVAERKQILKTSGRCFVCLRKYHMSRDCRSNSRCAKCSGKHHVSICTGGPSRPATRNQPSAAGVSQGNPRTPPCEQSTSSQSNTPTNITPTTSMYCESHNTPVLLQTARAQIFKPSNPGETKEIRLIFDNGSQRSYITNKLVDLLSLTHHHTETMIIKTFGSSEGSKQACKVVSIGLNLKDGGTLKLSLLSVPLICEPLSCQPITYVRKNLDYVSSLDLADHCYDNQNLDIDVLIGCDQYWKLVTGQVIHRGYGPVAVNTRLGWVLSGPVNEGVCPDSAINFITTHSMLVDVYVPEDSSQDLDGRLKMFWELESLGVKQEESSVCQEFQKEITFKNGRYEVSLPWKQSHPILPDHYDLALRRLNGLLKRLQQNSDMLLQYDTVIKEQLNRGIIEVVDKPQARTNHQVHYLPHHAVIREDKKTTKLRIVYDASARTNGPALNDCLYTGPKFGQKIMDIIMRFRIHKVALTADVEKAFLMISVSPQDRDVLRFLWIDNIHKKPPEVVVFRLSFLVYHRVLFYSTPLSNITLKGTEKLIQNWSKPF